jgi:hypothetical protein
MSYCHCRIDSVSYMYVCVCVYVLSGVYLITTFCSVKCACGNSFRCFEVETPTR